MKTSRFIGIFLILLFCLFSLAGCGFFTQNKEPTASFSLTPSTGKAPLEVEMNASSSLDPDGNIINYNWSFGGGSSGTGKTVTHIYNTEGNYSVRLTVEDDEGASNSATKTVEVQKGGSFEFIQVSITKMKVKEDTDPTFGAETPDPDFIINACGEEVTLQTWTDVDMDEWHTLSLSKEFPLGGSSGCDVIITMKDNDVTNPFEDGDRLADTSFYYSISDGSIEETVTEDDGAFVYEVKREE